MQGHDVCYGTETDHVCIFIQNNFLILSQSGSQLEGNTYTGQHPVGIAAIRTVGIYDGNCLGQLLLALVVIRDHQIDTQLLAKLCLFHGGDTAVDGNDQLDALPMQLPDGNGIQTVALLQPSGNVGKTVGTAAAQKICQQAGGGNTVHVIVAEYGDPLSAGKGKAHPVGRQCHVLHGKRIRHGAAAVQICFCFIRPFHASGGKDHGGKGRKSRSHQRVHSTHLRLCYVPYIILHTDTHPILCIFSILYQNIGECTIGAGKKVI